MRPRSLPWLALHAFAIVAGTIQLVGVLGTSSGAVETSYGQGYLVGRLIWVGVAAFAIKKLLQEYGGTGGAATAAINPAFVPTAQSHAPFECDAIVAPAPAPGYRASQTTPVVGPTAHVNHQPAFPEPPAYGPGSTYVEAALPYGGASQVYGAASQVRSSVAPPGR